MPRFIIIFTLLLYGVYSYADDYIMPYSVLTPENTKKLECAFSSVLNKQSMRDNLNNLDIQNAADVLFYMNSKKDKPINNFAKALILDYMYKSGDSIDYYRKSMRLVNKNQDIAYDIAFFLARAGKVKSSFAVLDKEYNIMNEFAISKLKAYILLANDSKITHDILFKCKKRNFYLDDIKTSFNECNSNNLF